MRARTRARKRALDVLFESEARHEDPIQVLKQRRAHEDAPPVSAYAEMLVNGVSENRERIDQILTEHSEGWSVPRMPAVDRTVLRIGLYELLWVDEIDDPVAITEAVELARMLSTDDSPRFVNGVLGRISDIAQYLRPGLQPAPAVPAPDADSDLDVEAEIEAELEAETEEPDTQGANEVDA